MMLRVAIALCLLTTLAVPAALAQSPIDRGVGLLEQGKTKEAGAQFEALLRSNPKNAIAAYWLGRVAFQQDDAAKASEWFEKAVQLSPRSSDYHLWLGRAYGREAMRANPFKQASLARKVKGQFEKAVELDPDSLEARSGLLEFYMVAPGIMGGSEEKAMQQAAEIAKRDPIAGVRETAKVHRAKGRPAVAEKTLVEAIRKNGNRDLRRDLGFHYQQQKQWQNAYTIFHSLVTDDATDMASHYQIGRTAAMSGQFLDAGEQSLEKYLSHTPKQDEPPLKWAHVRLGTIYEKKQRIDLARAAYSQALKLDPGMKEAKEALAKVR